MKDATMKDILLAGSAGGVAFWAYTLLRGGQPAAEVAQFTPEVWLWVSLALVVIVGAAAAFLMVYFIAATNTKERMRAVGFAVACGLCWDPVLAGVKESFTREYADRDAAKVVAEARTLTKPAPEQAASVAAKLVESAPQVQNPILQKQVREQADRLLQTIDATADQAARTQALQTVGVAAAQAQESVTLAKTMKSLEMIADTQPQHAPNARDALRNIDARIATRSRAADR
jgi:hypothetical protein